MLFKGFCKSGFWQKWDYEGFLWVILDNTDSVPIATSDVKLPMISIKDNISIFQERNNNVGNYWSRDIVISEECILNNEFE